VNTLKIIHGVYYFDISITFCKQYYNFSEIHVLKASSQFLMVLFLFLSQSLNALIFSNLNKGYEIELLVNALFWVIQISYMFF